MTKCRNRDCKKRNCKKLDFTNLLGFETVGAELAGPLDFQNETFADRLGAKVGGEITGAKADQ